MNMEIPEMYVLSQHFYGNLTYVLLVVVDVKFVGIH